MVACGSSMCCTRGENKKSCHAGNVVEKRIFYVSGRHWKSQRIDHEYGPNGSGFHKSVGRLWVQNSVLQV